MLLYNNVRTVDRWAICRMQNSRIFYVGLSTNARGLQTKGLDRVCIWRVNWGETPCILVSQVCETRARIQASHTSFLSIENKGEKTDCYAV